MNNGKPVEGKEIFVRVGHVLQKVDLSKVTWIKSDGNYCLIHTQEDKFVVKISLTKLLDSLPEESFVQIHRSYALRLSQVTQIDLQSNVLYIGRTPLPLGRKFKDNLLEKIILI